MVFMKKIKSAANKLKNKEERQQEFIASGGRVLADLEEENEYRDEWTKINLRVPIDMLEDIIPFISKRRRETRTSFILDAIQEKIDRLKEDL